MKHTKGPWKVVFERRKNIIIGSKKRGICIIPNEGEPDEKKKLANAHLISAAPDMLKALEDAKMLIDCCMSHIDDWDEYQDICEAIKKARGEDV